MAEDIISTFSNNSDLYSYALADAYDSGIVFDPDYALANDPNIYRKVRHDPVINHAIEYRKHLVAGPEWTMEPADDSPPDKLGAAITEEAIAGIERFREALFQQADATFMGSSWALVEGRRVRRSIAGGKPAEWWMPTRIRPMDKRRFQLREDVAASKAASNGEQRRVYVWHCFNTNKREWVKIDVRQFIHHVYDDSEDSLGYGRGLLAALYHFYRAKVVALREGLMGLERWAQGFNVVKFDTQNLRQASTTTVAQLVTDAKKEFEKHLGRHWMFMDKADEIETHQWPGNGGQIVLDYINYLDNSCRGLILGAQLPTGANQGSGSMARAIVEERSTDSLIAYDWALRDETLDRDLIGAFWRHNRGLLASMGLTKSNQPHYKTRGRKIVNPKDFAATAAVAMNSERGIREDEFYGGLGLTAPREGEAVIKAKEALPGEPLPVAP